MLYLLAFYFDEYAVTGTKKKKSQMALGGSATCLLAHVH